MANQVGWSFYAKDKFSRIADKINSKTKLMQTNFKKVNATMKRTASRMKAIGTATRNMSLAAAAAIAASAKAFGDMEKGVTNVLTLLVEGDGIKKYGKKVKELAENSLLMGFGMDEANQALFDTISALGASESTFNAFTAAQELAIGGASNLAVATLGTARVMNAYQDQMLDATDVTDAFFVAQLGGTTDVEKLARNIGKVAKTASAVGIEYKELLATTAELTQSFSTEESMTGIKALINSLTAPSKEAIPLLKKYGIATTASELRTIGWTKTLQNLAIMGEKNIDHLKKAIPSIEASGAAMALTDTSVKKIIKSIGKMGTGLLDKAVALQMETLNQSVSETWGAITLLGAELGSFFAPVIKAIGKTIRFLVVWFKSWNVYIKQTVAVILGLAAVIAPLFATIGAFLAFITPGVSIIAGIGAALVGWPIAIVAIVAALGSFLAMNWDKVIKVWNVVKGWFGFSDKAKKFSVSGQAEIMRKSEARIAVELTANPGTSANVRTKTSGPDAADIGVNMIHGFP
jgi:TP901 family phage tail tape measure protein